MPMPAIFYDCHAHVLHQQSGGFLIGTEGTPALGAVLSNVGVRELENRNKGLVAVPYIEYREQDTSCEGDIAKYHARREGYDADWVARDIKRFKRKIVLLDTLNALEWPADHYKTLARSLPDTQFVMCHGGGYDIVEFVKFARFIPNVWLDFSATQHIFGWAGDKPPFLMVCDAIDHSMSEPRIRKKLMFGSDAPGFGYMDAIEKMLARESDPSDILAGNFLRLIDHL